MTENPVRVRFAPSPTGRFHIGSARTALYNYLLAKQTTGKFILRLEDTDYKRFDPTSEDEIISSMQWLGMEWDEGPNIGGEFGPYRQSERKTIYETLSQELVERGNAYYCFCSPERLANVRKEQQKHKKPPRYDGLCRKLTSEEAAERVAQDDSFVVRFKTPRDGTTTAIDLLRDPITVENKTIDDYILIKSDGMPVYHFAAMTDDHLMQITHVFRGSEWLPTFPLHVLIYQAFDWKQPIWVHLSIFLNPTGKGKLSKRDSASQKGGAKQVFVLELRDLGYLPEAVTNWIALMGWSFDDHTEVFSLQDLINGFSLAKLNSSPAAVNYSKLDHFNGIHIRNLAVEDLAARVRPFYENAGFVVDDNKLMQMIPLVQERIRTLVEAVEISGFFFQDEVHPERAEIVGKGMTPEQSVDALQSAHDQLKKYTSLDAEIVEADLRELALELSLKVGQFFGILRVAITGQRISPPLIESMQIIGNTKVLQRINHAIALLQQVETSN
jgi:glutamyl-tRNA synthetase